VTFSSTRGIALKSNQNRQNPLLEENDNKNRQNPLLEENDTDASFQSNTIHISEQSSPVEPSPPISISVTVSSVSYVVESSGDDCMLLSNEAIITDPGITDPGPSDPGPSVPINGDIGVNSTENGSRTII